MDNSVIRMPARMIAADLKHLNKDCEMTYKLGFFDPPMVLHNRNCENSMRKNLPSTHNKKRLTFHRVPNWDQLHQKVLTHGWIWIVRVTQRLPSYYLATFKLAKNPEYLQFGRRNEYLINTTLLFTSANDQETSSSVDPVSFKQLRQNAKTDDVRMYNRSSHF